MIIHWYKDSDYYIVRMYQDLVGDWIVSRSWGNTSLGYRACRHTVAPSYLAARSLVKEISQQRKTRGYVRYQRNETQLGFNFE